MNFNDAKITVIKSKRKTISIQVKAGEVIIRAPLRMKDKEIEAFAESKRRWIETHLESAGKKEIPEPFTAEEMRIMTAKAKEIIPPKVKFYAEKTGVDYGRITIRSQRTRFGSCSSKGNLNFNCVLVLMPEEVLDSVIIHELCHRKHMNHSQKFYAEMKKFCPDYQIHRRYLKEYGSQLIARIPK